MHRLAGVPRPGGRHHGRCLRRDGFTEQEHADFVAATGVFRQTLSEAMSKLPDVDKPHYDAWAKSPAATRLRSMEERLIRHRVGADVLPVSGEEWRKTTEAALADLHTVTVTAGDRLLERITPVAVGVIVRLVLAGGLGLLAVIASIVLSITTTRQLLAQLKAARRRPRAGRRAAARRGRAARPRRGGRRRRRGARRSTSATTRSARSGQAFNAVQRDRDPRRRRAGRAAPRHPRHLPQPGPPHARRWCTGSSPCWTRWSAAETDPEELEELFRLDHLATRMRRNAENLIVLSGAAARPRLAPPVPMVDVVRGALAEVEDYTRVTLLPMGEVVLRRPRRRRRHPPAGRADRERGLVLARRTPTVQVGGQLVANGYAIEIEDRGLGMKPEDLDGGQRAHRRPAGVQPHQHRPAGPVRGRPAGRAPRHQGGRSSSRPTAAPPPSCCCRRSSWRWTPGPTRPTRTPRRACPAGRPTSATAGVGHGHGGPPGHRASGGPAPGERGQRPRAEACAGPCAAAAAA